MINTECRTDQTAEAAEYAASVLKNGGLVVFPTETVYGLGALLSATDAVHRIYEIKGRDEKKPLSILIGNTEQMEELAPASEERKAAMRLAEAFWPGPLTVVLPKTGIVPDIVTAGGSTVGFRMPVHQFALELLHAAGEPVVTTSANLSGQPAAVSAEEAIRALDGKVELIIAGGECPVQVPSTVVGLQEDGILIFREGIISEEQIRHALSNAYMEKDE